MDTKREQAEDFEGFYEWKVTKDCVKILHITQEDKVLYKWLKETKDDWKGFRRLESLSEARWMIERYFLNWHRDDLRAALDAYDEEDRNNLEVLEGYAGFPLNENKGDAYDMMEWDKECVTTI